MEKQYKLNRRAFIKKTAAYGTLFTLSTPFFALPRAFPDLTRHGLKILDFAHLTDVHITDGTNPLRAEVFDNIPGLGASWRPQQNMSAVAFDAVVRLINQEHDKIPFDFIISTGDQVDNAMRNEFQWFTDIINGNEMPEFYQKLVAKNIMPRVDPHGLDAGIPFYAAIGNHDTMIVGNFPAKLMEYIHFHMAKRYGFDIATQTEVIEILHDYGFGKMPGGVDGYYSFTPNEYIHCIVLNTNNDNWIEGLVDNFFFLRKDIVKRIVNKRAFGSKKIILYDILRAFFDWVEKQTGGVIGGISEGTLDRKQFAWMKREIEENSNKICLVFSHHGPDSFLSPIGNVTPYELKKTFCSYNNVIGHIYGHDHRNLITREEKGNGSYLSISTCSVIEYPQEVRRISIWDNRDGSGTISCRMFQHGYNKSIETSRNDPQLDKTYVGMTKDRDVDLDFNMQSLLQVSL